MTKAYARFLCGTFCAFLFGIGALHLCLPDRERSDTENRTLQQAPVLTAASVADGTFMTETEEYLADQFPGRDGWTGLKARAEQLLGKREFRGVYLCGDTLINRDDEPGEQAERNLDAARALAERTEIPVYLGLIPGAAEVWQDRLPAGAPRADQAAFIRHAAEQTGLETVDYLGALTAHGNEPVYYRTDHHWTSLGAYYGYAALCQALGEEPEPLEAFSPETVSDCFCGTLYSTSGVHWLPPDTIEYYVPEEGVSVTSWRSGAAEPGVLYDKSYLEKKDQYSSFLGGNQPLCVLENDRAASDRTILLLRDSYADSMAPFLTRTFARVHLIDLRYFHRSPAEYAAENGVDAVVVSYSVQSFVGEKSAALMGR